MSSISVYQVLTKDQKPDTTLHDNTEVHDALKEIINTDVFLNTIKIDGKKRIFVKGYWFDCYYISDTNDNNIIITFNI